MSKLKNKVVVITGGNSGIGFGIAETFRNEGAAGAITGKLYSNLAFTMKKVSLCRKLSHR